MRNKIAILVLIIAIGYIYHKRTTAPVWGPTVETKSGSVRGVVEISRDAREYFSFYQIPYAQPPVGPLRFETPQPVKKWEGVREEQNYGSFCAQVAFFPVAVTGSEDCLFLNVHVPKLATKELLPVIVFIHGGAFIQGSADQVNPSYFMDENIIIVSLNYRVGILGFTSTGDKHIRGNMGLKDQALALKWVHDNIPFFGGDPQKISVFGHSAGGASAHYLTLSETTRGLFKKVISLSGVSTSPWAFAPTQTQTEKTKNLARDLNCPTQDHSQLVDCLRRVDLNDLLAAYEKDASTCVAMYPSKGGVIFQPTVETVNDEQAFLTQSPYDVIAQGKAHKIPWMTGITKDEGLMNSFEFYRDEEALKIFENDWEKSLQNSFYFSPAFSAEKAKEASEKVREFYISKMTTHQEKLDKYTEMFSDGLFLVGVSTAASAQRQFSPVYLYHYTKNDGGDIFSAIMAEMKNRFGPTIEMLLVVLRVQWNKYVMGIPPKFYGYMHGYDGPMIYSLLPILAFGKEDPRYQFSKDLIKMFVDFASDVNDEKPLEFRGVKFVPNTKTKRPLVYLNLDEVPQMISEPFSHRTSFWESINYKKLFSSF